MQRPSRRRGIAYALTWFLMHIIAAGGGGTYVVLRTWQHTHSRMQTTLAAILFMAVLRIVSISQRKAHRAELRANLPRYYNCPDGTTAI